MAKLTHEYNLAVIYPQIAGYWHETKNGSIKPTDVVPNTKKKYWWFDPSCGHEWYKPVARMVRNYKHRANKNGGSGCPFCNTTKADSANCIAATHPYLINEWYQQLNGDTTPFNVTAGSNKKIYWICKYGHIWQARICNRTMGHRSGCSQCIKNISKPQLAIYAQLKIIFPDAQICKRINGTEFDIYIENNLARPIAIEYDGYPWHLKASAADLKKNKLAELLGIRLIRVRDKRLGKVCANDILIDAPKSKMDFNIMRQIAQGLQKYISKTNSKYKILSKYIGKNGFCKMGYDLYKTLRNEILLGTVVRRIDIEVPEIAKDWDHNANDSLKPHMVSTGSELRVWWICKRGHKKLTRVDLRVRSKGCVLCKRMYRLA